MQYGSTRFIGTPDAASIRRVSLIRTGSVTHAFDQNARAMSLNFTQTGGGLNVNMPANGNYAPPGYYMLFIVNGQGVPSVASFVRFPAPYEDAAAPTAPTDLSATAALGSASLSWTAATDDVGVARYDVHRSTTAGFTPSAANKVGQTASTSLPRQRRRGRHLLLPGDGGGRRRQRRPGLRRGARRRSPATPTPPTVPTGLAATRRAHSASLTGPPRATTSASPATGSSATAYRSARAHRPPSPTPAWTPGTTYSYTVSGATTPPATTATLRRRSPSRPARGGQA